MSPTAILVARRAVLSLAAALPAAWAAPSNPDAAMLAACAEFQRLNDVVYATPDHDDQALSAALDARNDQAELILTMPPPTTMAALKAKARVALVQLVEMHQEPDECDFDARFAWYALRDVVAAGVA